MRRAEVRGCRRKLCRAALLVLAVLLADAAAVWAADCAALAGLALRDEAGGRPVTIERAVQVAAVDGLPAFCQVRGRVPEAIDFEIRLPLAGWNGKFYMAGCGGFCGQLQPDRPGPVNAINHGLRRGYAVSTMDGGHAGEGATDARWALNDPAAEVDFGHRAVHETALVTKAVIRAFYGRAPELSYFDGCSNGGRQALMEASRYPADFNGILSGAPTLDFTRLAGVFGPWVVRANTAPDGGDVLDPAKLPLVEAAVLAACDARDGLQDGLIADPRRCDWEPGTLSCTDSTGADCLAAAEVETLRRWYQGPRDSAGRVLYPAGIPHGSEPFWWLWMTGDGQGRGRLVPQFVANYLPYMAFPEDPPGGFSPADYDFDRDPARVAAMAPMYDADDPDLSAFRDRGGRLLIHHGWADAIVPPERTVAYYEEVELRMGGPAATREFARLFMIPGMDHCGVLAGPGIDSSGFDPFSALERWVERGEPPTRLIATKRDGEGRVVRTRPLCPYPQVATYRGSGSTDDAASFVCAEP